jgi:predicted Zn-dependent peptidase
VTKRDLITADRPGAPQSTVRIGLPVPSPAHKDYIPLQVTDSMLGGSFMSRITTNIREQKGYTYSPYSYVATHFGDAFWVHTSDVTTASTGAAMTEIVNEIEKVRREPPSTQELKGYEENLAGLFVLQNSSPAGIIGRLNFVDLHGLGDNWLNTYVQQVTRSSPPTFSESPKATSTRRR